MASSDKLRIYLQKADMYSLLSDYYKYLDPNLHVMYYYKHLRNLKKATQIMSQDSSRTPEANAPSMLRFLHASPDTLGVDIYVNGVRMLRDFDYKEDSTRLPLPPGKYQIDIYPAGQSVTAVISRKVTIEKGKYYTSAIAGPGSKLKLITFTDHPMTPAGEAKVRFIHLSPDAPAVDIAAQNGDVIFANTPFQQATSYLGLTPMTVTLQARVAGTNNTVLTIPDIKLEPNTAYTAVAVGTVKGEPPLEVLLLKD